LSNYYNVYRPAQGAMVGVPAFQNVGHPIDLICGGIAGLANDTSKKGADLCIEYLGPLLNTIKANYPDLSINPTRALGALPDQLVYSEPDLEPTGALSFPTVPVASDLTGLLMPSTGSR
jgi:phospholipid/cholesterol/gamma-HCH transport system substrate-binding protein